MGRSSKESWLEGPGDLKEADVQDVPVKGESVRVRGLPAAYSNQATSEAMEIKVTARGEQIGTVNQAKMEELQFAHGVIEPRFTPEEAHIVATKYGPAFRKVVDEIDRLSGVDKEAIERANATFPVGGAGEAGKDVGDAAPNGAGGPDLSVRAGA